MDAQRLPIVLIKAGFHGQESLDEIVKRKSKEESVAGKVFWGYGGSLCHPISQVLPFVRRAQGPASSIRVVMPITMSKCDLTPSESREFSVDGVTWNLIPLGITVRSCRYALVIRNLRPVSEVLDLNSYSVAVGPNEGKRLSEHIRARIDKACALPRVVDQTTTASPIKIGLAAELTEPFAVLLR